MAEMAVQGLLEFWPCKSVNNQNFGLPIANEVKELTVNLPDKTPKSLSIHEQCFNFLF